MRARCSGPVLGLAVVLGACAPEPRVEVVPEELSVTVSRPSLDFPRAHLQVRLAAEPDRTLYVKLDPVNSIRWFASFGDRTSRTVDVDLVFTRLDGLGGGELDDQITISACTEASCQHHLPGSPRQVKIRMLVDGPPPTLVRSDPFPLDFYVIGSSRTTLAVSGFDCLPGATILWNDRELTTTPGFRWCEFTAEVPVSERQTPQVARLSLRNPGKDGGVSNALDFEVLPPGPPVLQSVRPRAVGAGTPSRIALLGSNFHHHSHGTWNPPYWGDRSHWRPTTLVSPTELAVDLSAEDLAVPGTFTVWINNYVDLDWWSEPLELAVVGPAVVTAISPSVLHAGDGPIDLRLTGESLGPSTTALWNGQPRPATWTRLGPHLETLDVRLSGQDLAGPGTATLQVTPEVTPLPATDPLSITILP